MSRFDADATCCCQRSSRYGLGVMINESLVHVFANIGPRTIENPRIGTHIFAIHNAWF